MMDIINNNLLDNTLWAADSRQIMEQAYVGFDVAKDTTSATVANFANMKQVILTQLSFSFPCVLICAARCTYRNRTTSQDVPEYITFDYTAG